MDKNEVYQVKEISLKLIGEAHTEGALNLLKKFLKEKDKELYAQLLLISNQFFDAKKDRLLGLGNKNKIIARVNYSLIIFINNLEFGLTNKSDIQNNKQESEKEEKLIYVKGLVVLAILVGVYLMLFRSDNTKPLGLENKVKELKEVRGESTYSASSMSNLPYKKNKIALRYKSNKSKEVHAMDFYLSTKLIEVKERFMKEYEIRENNDEKDEWIEWILVRGRDAKYSKDDELLSLESLLSQNKISEHDELMIAKSTMELTVNESSQSFYRHPSISAGSRGDKWVTSFYIRDYPLTSIVLAHDIGSKTFGTSTYGTKSVYLSPDSQYVETDTYKYVLKPLFNHTKPIKPKNQNRNFYFLNRYGIKPDDEIYILSEEDDEDMEGNEKSC
ncbi:MAG: hypothetical protein JNM22_13515 [Saprospiraceae bacterium]|nr:hypothetical protein [Saprospiraceae bacterium]